MELVEQQALINELKNDLLPQKFGIRGKIWTFLLLIIIAVGLYAYYLQLRDGLVVTGMGDYVSWGIYISNFVFLVAVSLVGSLITAVLYLVNVKWRAPLTRIAEVIAVAAIMFAGLIIIVDMGRPERMFNLFIYGRVQSPILWDVMVVMTYMTISLLLLYFPLLPGMAYCRDHMTDIPKWQHKMYKILALRWRGTKAQFDKVHKAIRILAVMIIPVALSIHTVTSWLFATTFRAGWDSTNFGPYFVSGAFMVGAAAVIAGMYVFSKAYKNYDKYITKDHFDKMGKLLVMLSLVYLYFNINEYIVPAYKMKGMEAVHLKELVFGHYAGMFWFAQIGGMILPLILLLFKKMRTPGPIFIIALIVIVAAWVKRFLIVIPTMLHPFIPMQEVQEKWMHYSPTWQEIAIMSASLAGTLLVMTIFVRFFPILSIWEIAEERGVDMEKLNQSIDEK
ncbi:MAG: polysulfide reductase [Bacteroidetes bacterium RIFCSPLOWO2_12_FULL_31_6]|nr:MAG: polysulfide reductase [Bacteroidetes bacterium RIFCSPLOWO2_12_FULL_31_6]